MPKKATPDTSALQQQIATLTANHQRALADYQNLQKRHQADRQEYLKFASSQLITHLLPVLDDLYRAQDHLQDSGLQMVIAHFLDVLKNEGVTEINAQDQIFDAKLMECVEVVPGPENQVVSVLTRGYQMNELILRPARVTVGNTPITNQEIKN